MSTNLGLYREAEHQMPEAFLPNEVYAQAIEGFVIDCTDAVIVDRLAKTFWLAKRNVLPMKGVWVIGGRRYAGEEQEVSVRRCFKRETGLDLDINRFVHAADAEYIWKDRKQSPQEVGSHNLAHIFAVELTPEERGKVSASLIRDEYEAGWGLRAFDRTDLEIAKVHPVLIRLHDLIFTES